MANYSNISPTMADHQWIVGSCLSGGEEIVMHAVMETPAEGKRIYCKPETPMPTIDFGPDIHVTCFMCKTKLRSELTFLEGVR